MDQSDAPQPSKQDHETGAAGPGPSAEAAPESPAAAKSSIVPDANKLAQIMGNQAPDARVLTFALFPLALIAVIIGWLTHAEAEPSQYLIAIGSVLALTLIAYLMYFLMRYMEILTRRENQRMQMMQYRQVFEEVKV